MVSKNLNLQKKMLAYLITVSILFAVSSGGYYHTLYQSYNCIDTTDNSKCVAHNLQCRAGEEIQLTFGLYMFTKAESDCPAEQCADGCCFKYDSKSCQLQYNSSDMTEAMSKCNGKRSCTLKTPVLAAGTTCGDPGSRYSLFNLKDIEEPYQHLSMSYMAYQCIPAQRDKVFESLNCKDTTDNRKCVGHYLYCPFGEIYLISGHYIFTKAEAQCNVLPVHQCTDRCCFKYDRKNCNLQYSSSDMTDAVSKCNGKKSCTLETPTLAAGTTCVNPGRHFFYWKLNDAERFQHFSMSYINYQCVKVPATIDINIKPRKNKKISSDHVVVRGSVRKDTMCSISLVHAGQLLFIQSNKERTSLSYRQNKIHSYIRYIGRPIWRSPNTLTLKVKGPLKDLRIDMKSVRRRPKMIVSTKCRKITDKDFDLPMSENTTINLDSYLFNITSKGVETLLNAINMTISEGEEFMSPTSEMATGSVVNSRHNLKPSSHVTETGQQYKLHESFNCKDTTDNSKCVGHNLQCGVGEEIFLISGHYIFTKAEAQCNVLPADKCTDRCCFNYDSKNCNLKYSSSDMTDAVSRCNGKRSCTLETPTLAAGTTCVNPGRHFFYWKLKDAKAFKHFSLSYISYDCIKVPLTIEIGDIISVEPQTASSEHIAIKGSVSEDTTCSIHAVHPNKILLIQSNQAQTPLFYADNIIQSFTRYVVRPVWRTPNTLTITVNGPMVNLWIDFSSISNIKLTTKCWKTPKADPEATIAKETFSVDSVINNITIYDLEEMFQALNWTVTGGEKFMSPDNTVLHTRAERIVSPQTFPHNTDFGLLLSPRIKPQPSLHRTTDETTILHESLNCKDTTDNNKCVGHNLQCGVGEEIYLVFGHNIFTKAEAQCNVLPADQCTDRCCFNYDIKSCNLQYSRSDMAEAVSRCNGKQSCSLSTPTLADDITCANPGRHFFYWHLKDAEIFKHFSMSVISYECVKVPLTIEIGDTSAEPQTASSDHILVKGSVSEDTTCSIALVHSDNILLIQSNQERTPLSYSEHSIPSSVRYFAQPFWRNPNIFTLKVTGPLIDLKVDLYKVRSWRPSTMTVTTNCWTTTTSDRITTPNEATYNLDSLLSNATMFLIEQRFHAINWTMTEGELLRWTEEVDAPPALHTVNARTHIQSILKATKHSKTTKSVADWKIVTGCLVSLCVALIVLASLAILKRRMKRMVEYTAVEKLGGNAKSTGFIRDPPIFTKRRQDEESVEEEGLANPDQENANAPHGVL